MTKIELLNTLRKNAGEYRLQANKSIKRNNHMNNATSAEIHQDDIDALLTDFINYVAMKQCVDYGMYTSDLKTSEVVIQ